MAPPLTNDDRVKFLISCIQHSQNGKVNFEAVAHENDIPTKGAAAKRYERLLKAHGKNAHGEQLISNPTTPKRSHAASYKAESEENGEENAEGGSPAKKPRKTKAGSGKKTAQSTSIKTEEEETE